MADDLRAALLDLETHGWQSLCDGTGAEFYGGLMTDDGLMVLANGAVMDREAVVAALGQSPAWQRFEIEDLHLVAEGPDRGVLVYTGRAYRNETDPPFVGAMSSLYVRAADGWRLALYTQTPVA